MTAMAAASPNRHPWLDLFLSQPLEQLAQLLNGRANIYPFTRADSVDAARMLFGGLDPNDPARIALSSAIVEWLGRARTRQLSVTPAVRQRELRQISDVFEIIGTLELVVAAEQLRRQYVRWWAWVDRLPSLSARDPRAAYLRMLANTQPSLRDRFDDPDGLSPLWMRICADAGQLLPDSYLHIGLSGLRKLPQASHRGDSPWITGVAEWALANDPAPAQFLEVWRPLKRLYPSSDALLRRQVNSLLSQPAFKDAGIEPPGWWLADPKFQQQQDRITPSFEPPSRNLHESLIEALKAGRPFPALRGRVRQLIEAHRQYASRSGDSDYLARSFCNVGRKLIETGTDSHEERVRLAETLARETLNHYPFDIYAWSLWRDSLMAGGAYEAARDLGWDIIRRFPNSVQARSLLAELMIAGNETEEALLLAKASIQDEISNATLFTLVARIEGNRGNWAEAMAAASEAASLEPDNDRTLATLQKMKSGICPPLASSHFVIGEQVEGIGQDAVILEIIRSGRLRSLRETLRAGRTPLSQLQRSLEEDPDSVYANLLGARYGLWRADEDALPPVAAAFEMALAEEDRARLELLAERAPRLKALIELGRALFGDEESAEYIQRLLETEDERSLVMGEKLLRWRLKPLLQDITTGASALEVLQHNKLRVIHALNDANEALATSELLAA